jgi:hypothetical protein
LVDHQYPPIPPIDDSGRRFTTDSSDESRGRVETGLQTSGVGGPTQQVCYQALAACLAVIKDPRVLEVSSTVSTEPVTVR